METLSAEDEAELRHYRAMANEGLTGISRILMRESHPGGIVRFPRDYLLTVSEAEDFFRVIRDHRLRRNVAYAVQLQCVYGWLLERTDVALSARSLLIKADIAIIGSIMEALLRDFQSGAMGVHAKHKKRMDRLVKDGVIDTATRVEADWLWDMRNQTHIHLAPGLEFDKYTDDMRRRAYRAIRQLNKRLGESIT